MRRTVNPFPNKPWFSCVCSLSLLKILGKIKFLVTSNFSFSNSIFYPHLGEFFAIFIDFEIVVCKLFQYGTIWNLSFGKGLKIKGLKVLKVALMVIDGHHPFTWQSCFYVIETNLENRAERKTHFFTQGFLPIRLKFNGSSHIWLVFSNLTSLQFSWANAVTCNRYLPTELDLFIFFL